MRPMEEESVSIVPGSPNTDSHPEVLDDDPAKRPPGYPFLRDPRTENLYGIDPWGNDWGE